MRALVTGGAGFIGSHTADALLKGGWRVRILDALTPPVHPRPEPPAYLDKRFEFMRGDVRDEAALAAALQGCDAVFHLAAFQDYLPLFKKFIDVNVSSTALLYEIIVREKLPVRKVVVASSQAALGEGLYCDAQGRTLTPSSRSAEQLARGEWEIPAPAGYAGPLQWRKTDERVANPQNQYGVSKLAEEQVALCLGERFEIPTVAMRYSIVQGPRQSFHNAYSGACRVFSLAFRQGKDPIIYEDGRQVRDFVNIHDVVDANMLVLEEERADQRKLHVGGGKAIAVDEFARIVARVYGRDDYEPRPSGRYRFGDTRHICSDTAALEALGWRATRSCEESVAAYKDWLATADSIDEIIESAQRHMAELDVVREVRSQ